MDSNSEYIQMHFYSIAQQSQTLQILLDLHNQLEAGHNLDAPKILLDELQTQCRPQDYLENLSVSIFLQ